MHGAIVCELPSDVEVHPTRLPREHVTRANPAKKMGEGSLRALPPGDENDSGQNWYVSRNAVSERPRCVPSSQGSNTPFWMSLCPGMK